MPVNIKPLSFSFLRNGFTWKQCRLPPILSEICKCLCMVQWEALFTSHWCSFCWVSWRRCTRGRRQGIFCYYCNLYVNTSTSSVKVFDKEGETHWLYFPIGCYYIITKQRSIKTWDTMQEPYPAFHLGLLVHRGWLVGSDIPTKLNSRG